MATVIDNIEPFVATDPTDADALVPSVHPLPGQRKERVSPTAYPVPPLFTDILAIAELIE